MDNSLSVSLRMQDPESLELLAEGAKRPQHKLWRREEKHQQMSQSDKQAVDRSLLCFELDSETPQRRRRWEC